MTLQELIKNIVPFYNQYKKEQETLSGTDALEIIWEVGNLLKKYLSDKVLAPRNLYVQIYGKSEGSTNIAQKSYITRDFLDRAYRVRRIFETKGEIRTRFPSLARYRLFYKAMPFFDEGRFKLGAKEQEKLADILNSNLKYKQILQKVTELRQEKIGLSISHDSKLKELIGDKEIFTNFYIFLYNLISSKDFRNIRSSLLVDNNNFYSNLSRNTGALVRDDLQFVEFKMPAKIDENLKSFAELIIRLIERKDAKVRRRFRRLIKPESMMKLSEMISALVDENNFKNFRL